MSRSAALAPFARLRRSRPARALLGRFLETASRAGYAARGAVYVAMGLIALLAALDLAPRAEGAAGALEPFARWPLGIALLWLVGLGLAGFSLWRALQSVFDADRQGTSPAALFARAGQAVSGLVYAALAVSTFGLLDTLDDLGDDDREATEAAVARALTVPGGELLVVALGGFILACGVAGLAQALFRDFCRPLACDERLEPLAGALGRIGYGARGIVFLVAGGFTLAAGLSARAGEARGMGSALDWLEALPFGQTLLGLTALGLAAFGAFAFVEARWRRMNVG